MKRQCHKSDLEYLRQWFSTPRQRRFCVFQPCKSDAFHWPGLGCSVCLKHYLQVRNALAIYAYAEVPSEYPTEDQILDLISGGGGGKNVPS